MLMSARLRAVDVLNLHCHSVREIIEAPVSM